MRRAFTDPPRSMAAKASTYRASGQACVISASTGTSLYQALDPFERFEGWQHCFLSGGRCKGDLGILDRGAGI